MNARETYTKIERLLRDKSPDTQKRIIDGLSATRPSDIPTLRAALGFLRRTEEPQRVVAGLRTLLLGEPVE